MEHVARSREMRNDYEMLAGKPEGKRPFGRYRHRGENNAVDKQDVITFIELTWLNT